MFYIILSRPGCVLKTLVSSPSFFPYSLPILFLYFRNVSSWVCDLQLSQFSAAVDAMRRRVLWFYVLLLVSKWEMCPLAGWNKTGDMKLFLRPFILSLYITRQDKRETEFGNFPGQMKNWQSIILEGIILLWRMSGAGRAWWWKAEILTPRSKSRQIVKFKTTQDLRLGKYHLD